MLWSDAAELCSHLLWECSFAQAIWLQAPFRNSFVFPLNIQFMDIMDAALHKLHSPEFEILCVALWMIWTCRNKFIFENKIPCSDGLRSRASVYVMEFMEVNKTGLAVLIAPDRKWSPPLSDSVFKLNLDLSQSRSKASVGVGFLICNSKGEVLAASCERVRKELHSLWIAAVVMRKALVFCLNTCFSKVIIEGNFVELVAFINSYRICTLEVAWILEDIKLICEQFVSISFVSIPLKCNCTALALSSAAKENEEAIV